LEELRFGALRVRGWSRGCDICWRGGKLVLFVTGACPMYGECAYCTISSWRRRDIVMADEVLVEGEEDLLREARAIDAEGAGVTGGEPTLVPERVARFVSVLKEWRSDFHVHVYTNGWRLDEEVAALWSEAGVDEVRLHSWDREVWERLRIVLDHGMEAGAEMPAIPGREERLKELAERLDSMGAGFINLNELEFSEANRETLLAMGFRPREDSEVAVCGSRETAAAVLEFVERETGIMGYFCPAEQKEYQMWMRWRRRAPNVAEPYEEPTEDGTLIFGRIRGPRSSLEELAEELAASGVPLRLEDGELLVPPEVLLEIIGEFAELEAELVEVAPTDDRKELSVYPTDFLRRFRG